MKTGKISENILKRSVLNRIKNHREEVNQGAGVGEDCAFFSVKNACISTETISLPIKKAAYYAIYASANNIASQGAEPIFAEVSIILPKDAEEQTLQELMQQISDGCAEWNMELAGGHTEVSASVLAPIITITAVGQLHQERCEQLSKNNWSSQQKESIKSKKPLDLVVTKWIGMEGTAILADEKEKELLTRYPQDILMKGKKLEKYLSVAPEAAVAMKTGICKVHDIRNGGIFGALWEISRLLEVGFSVDLKKIPIKQETIEICEYFDLNPYILLSGGALLIACDNGEALVQQLAEEEIPACVIGQTTSGNDKIITNRDEIRYLDPTAPDEIFKVKFR